MEFLTFTDAYHRGFMFINDLTTTLHYCNSNVVIHRRAYNLLFQLLTNTKIVLSFQNQVNRKRTKNGQMKNVICYL